MSYEGVDPAVVRERAIELGNRLRLYAGASALTVDAHTSAAPMAREVAAALGDEVTVQIYDKAPPDWIWVRPAAPRP